MQMDMKQKTLLVLTVAAFGYLGYQVYGLMKGDMGSLLPMVQSAPRYSQHTHLATSNNGPIQTANAAESVTVSSVPNVIVPSPVTLQHAPLEAGQKAYLHMVNQYELAKMKRRLLEERAAISAAQHRIATLNKQTRDIDSSLAGSADTYDHTETNTRRNVPYQLSYVDRQNGAWSATLSRSGYYFQVHVGSQLLDGAKVTHISRQGVTLQTGQSREKVTFEGIVAMPAEKAPVVVKLVETDIHPSSARLEEQVRHALLAANILTTRKVTTNLNDATMVKTQEKISKKAAATPDKKERDIVLATKKPAPKPMAKSPVKKPPEKKKLVIKRKVAVPVKTVVVKAPKPKAGPKPSVELAEVKKPKPIAVAPKPVKPITMLASAPRHTNTRYTEDEHRILALPKHSYTIQLIGSYHSDIVENFAIVNDLGNRAMQFHVRNRGKKWYMLLYDNYPTRSAAQAALNNLPPDLAPENPWIREVVVMRNDISRSKHLHKKT